MSDNNEIDDILNELKNKRTDNDTKNNADKRADDFFYTFTPPEKTEKNTADQSLTFDLNFNDDNKTEKAAAFNDYYCRCCCSDCCNRCGRFCLCKRKE